MSRGGSIEEKLEARRSKKVTLIAAGEEIEKSEIKVMTPRSTGDHGIHRGILQSAKTASTVWVPIPGCL